MFIILSNRMLENAFSSFISFFLSSPPSLPLFLFVFLQTPSVNGLGWKSSFNSLGLWRWHLAVSGPRVLSQMTHLVPAQEKKAGAQPTVWAASIKQESRLTALRENSVFWIAFAIMAAICSHKRDASGLRDIQWKTKTLSLPQTLHS